MAEIEPAGPWHDLSGVVLDDNNQPLANSVVLVILKTWPGGQYQQQSFAASSDGQGEFHLPKLIPERGQFAVQVAALKSGYALTSEYQLHEGPGHHAPEPISLRLPEAAPLTLVVRDGNGQPAVGARVLPASRQSPGGQQHLVYFQGSEPIQTTADPAGCAGLACFRRGDQAEIYIQLPGRDWEHHTVMIPLNSDRIVISAGDPQTEQPSVEISPTS